MYVLWVFMRDRTVEGRWVTRTVKPHMYLLLILIKILCLQDTWNSLVAIRSQTSVKLSLYDVTRVLWLTGGVQGVELVKIGLPDSPILAFSGIWPKFSSAGHLELASWYPESNQHWIIIIGCCESTPVDLWLQRAWFTRSGSREVRKFTDFLFLPNELLAEHPLQEPEVSTYQSCYLLLQTYTETACLNF